ncbi:MAG: class I SAM-dependent methyltransferase [Candidatus Moranbacteria bacterium]|nr:class I SAM-dependent methyltransferase [Candidatus Moranbacteria bacterium]
MDLKDTYNKIAKDWHKDHSRDEWWVEGTDKFISSLKENDLVLDVGCGAGTKSKYLIGKKIRVIGIDFSEEMIKIAKKEVPAGRFEVLDLDDIESLPELFDGIFMQAVLLHVPKKEVVSKLRKAVKRLKKGGYLYIAVKEKRRDGPEEEIVSENDYG